MGGLHPRHKGREVHGGKDRLLHLRQLAVVLHKGVQVVRHVMDGEKALPVVGGGGGRSLQEQLADAADGSRGIHYLMGEHAREALPRLHLVLGHQQAHVLPQGVEGAQQGALTRHPPYVGETEREIMVQHGLAHQVGASF